MEYYSAIREKETAICNTMNEAWQLYAKESVRQKR